MPLHQILPGLFLLASYKLICADAFLGYKFHQPAMMGIPDLGVARFLDQSSPPLQNNQNQTPLPPQDMYDNGETADAVDEKDVTEAANLPGRPMLDIPDEVSDVGDSNPPADESADNWEHNGADSDPSGDLENSGGGYRARDKRIIVLIPKGVKTMWHPTRLGGVVPEKYGGIYSIKLRLRRDGRDLDSSKEEEQSYPGVDERNYLPSVEKRSYLPSLLYLLRRVEEKAQRENAVTERPENKPAIGLASFLNSPMGGNFRPIRYFANNDAWNQVHKLRYRI